MPEPKTYIVRTPFLPLYSEIRAVLQILADSTSRSTFLRMNKEIYDQTGTPQNPVDWSNPDEWIPERLSGETRNLAMEIWKRSQGSVNPRYIYGAYYFNLVHELLIPDANDIFRWTQVGRGFVDSEPSTVRRIDEAEGIPQLLAIVARHSPAQRRDLLEDWGEFVAAHSKFAKKSTFEDTLRRRILNLIERGMIARDGNTYSITSEGIAYAADPERPVEEQPYQQVLGAIKRYNQEQIALLRERLGKMHPYRFESLVKDLLEAMEYEDVVVTKQSGDKGIDVVANFQFGITQIKEVVQVKRHQGSITRPVLDQLRGALPYHAAIRGTIITLGKFAPSCAQAAIFPGAAPITLIDGDKLIELLVKHGVGIKERKQTILEVDDEYFAADDSSAEAAPVPQTEIETEPEEVA